MMQEKENRSNDDLKKMTQQLEQRKLSQSVHTSQTLQQISQQNKSRRQSNALAALPIEENAGFGSRSKFFLSLGF